MEVDLMRYNRAGIGLDEDLKSIVIRIDKEWKKT